MKMRIGFTADDRSFVSRAIQHVTGGRYSHCLVIFDQQDGEPIYFESIFKRDPATGKNGVRGPIPLYHVTDWVAEKPGRRFYTLGPLPMTEQEVEGAYFRLAAAVHTIRYAPFQIIRNWIRSRIGLNLYFGLGSPYEWTCSETALRVIPRRFAEYFDLGDHHFDYYAPSGHRLPSVYDGVTRMIAG
jgi:hypothetical protein